MVERNGSDYAIYLSRVFADDPGAVADVGRWSLEEVQHGMALGRWAQLADPQFWWLGAMLGLWAIFIVMLFIAEPLFLHAWFDARARRDPDRAFRVALRGHRVLSTISLITVLGAVGGAHGLF